MRLHYTGEQMQEAVKHSGPVAREWAEDWLTLHAEVERLRAAADLAIGECQQEAQYQRERAEQLELKYRRALWAGHPHPFAFRYGDDGEMQCRAFDFKRAPLVECERHCDEAARAALRPEEKR